MIYALDPNPGRAAALLLLLVAPGLAHAGSSSSGEEYLSVAEAVEPNVLFVIDLSQDMGDPCPVAPDCYLDEAETIPCTASTTSCIDDVVDVIGQVTQHYDWARYGVVGTAESSSDSDFYPIVPLGSSHADVSNALATVSTWSEDTRNLGEVLDSLADDYFANTTPDDDVDGDSDGYSPDWDEAPIQYYCQETHVIYIVVDRSEDDHDASTSTYNDGTISPDIICDDDHIVTSPDLECLLDNVAGGVYDADLRSDLDDTQNLITHIIAIGMDDDSVANYLFGNATDQTDGEGIFTIAEQSDELLGGILTIMADIRSGFHSRSTPVLTADGEYLIYSYYELDGSNPLGEGHVRAYTINTDPSDSNYGQIEYLSGDPYDDYGGAYWDAGVLLQSRPVFQSDNQDADMDGDGLRDLFTFVDELAGSTTSYGSIARTNRRMDYDVTLVNEVARLESTFLPYFMDNSDADGDGLPDDSTYDVNGDGAVDYQDFGDVVDFERGYHASTFRYLDEERGYWKLGDSPHSTPAVVEPRNESFTIDPTYRTFLQTLEDDITVPTMVYIAANDGMLHAFYLEDDVTTATITEEGEEAWAWIPSYLLYWDHETMHGIEWPGRIIDQMLYGRTFLLDGTPVVDDVWLDHNGDGVRECDSDEIGGVADLADHCEWHRVLVVQQGKGGPVTLALDVTDPLDPKYLWEQIDLWDPTAQGYTVGRPVIAKVYDDRDSTAPTFRWVAIWGSGRAVTSGASLGYYQQVEPNLYVWGIGDDYLRSFDPAGLSWDGDTWDNSNGYRLDLGGNNGHPEAGFGNMTELWNGGGFEDTDDHYEHAYIAATPAVVDTDNDGDSDVIYFPVTTTYGSSDDSPSPRPWRSVLSQESGRDYQDPGDTWIWKAMIDVAGGTAEEDYDIQWCPTEFFDPKDAGITGLDSRPPVYYAITTSWMYDGSLGLYWGTGSPYERYTSDTGWFFAVKDPNPSICGAAEGIECDGEIGVFELNAGEGLTADPIVYAGVVFFSTYQPNQDDMCQVGTGRVYGLWYEDCSPALGDIDGDGIDDYSTEVDGYPSQVAISDQGTIFIGSSDVDSETSGIVTLSLAADSLMGTQTISWMEIF